MNINFQLDEFIKAALAEDIGTGDITTLSTIPADAVSSARFIAKEPGVIAGIDVAKRVYSLLDQNIQFESLVHDGTKVSAGDVVAAVSGNSRAILMAERISLNLLQHLSGIATQTRKAVDAVAGTNAKIADTRKTTPGMRVLEKQAVKTGGGVNHRFNLSDGVLIKDNHIVASGGIANAIAAARANVPHTLKIEVEVENFTQLDEALAAGADIIMLDNMSSADMAKAVKIIAGRAITEASGNMGDKDLLEVAKTGVDIISIGSLTRSVRSLDISLKFN